MNRGCIQLQVAPATLNCVSSRSAGRSQGRRQPARSSARTLDGALVRRLSTQYSDTQLNYQPRGLNCLSDEVPPFTHLRCFSRMPMLSRRGRCSRKSPLRSYRTRNAANSFPGSLRMRFAGSGWGRCSPTPAGRKRLGISGARRAFQERAGLPVALDSRRGVPGGQKRIARIASSSGCVPGPWR